LLAAIMVPRLFVIAENSTFGFAETKSNNKRMAEMMLLG
jgi:hypothetical protein